MIFETTSALMADVCPSDHLISGYAVLLSVRKSCECVSCVLGVSASAALLFLCYELGFHP